MIAVFVLLAAAAAGPPGSAIAMRPLLPAYVCPDGSLVEVDEARGRAVVSADGAALDLAADGPGRYAGGGVAVEVGAQTLRFQRDGNAGQPRGAPAEVCARRPPGPTDQAFWGQIAWEGAPGLERVDLLVVDGARRGENRPPVAAARLALRPGAVAPLHFVVALQPERLFPGIDYVLVARGFDGRGRLVAEGVSTALFAAGPHQPPLLLTMGPPAAP